MTTMEDRKRKLVIGRFKNSVLTRFNAINPYFSINSAHSSIIQNKLHHLFDSFHTPTHPPYASMIKRSIMELNEENGSTEEAISEFIRREYKDLPWAHVSILDLHLRRLCRNGDLVCADGERYMLPVDCSSVKNETQSSDSKRRKCKKLM